MNIQMGSGNVAVTTYGDKEIEYGLALKVTDEVHEIGYKDISVIGKTIDEYQPTLTIEFSKSASVQVVIDMLTLIKNSLLMQEEQ